MGLLWSMKLAQGERKGGRLMKKDVTKPFRVQLSVHPDHVKVDDKDIYMYSSSKILAQTTLKRSYLAHDVQRVPVKAGRVRGMLFLPPGTFHLHFVFVVTHNYLLTNWSICLEI